MKPSAAGRLVRDLAGELETVLKADNPEQVENSSLPLLHLCADAHCPGSEGSAIEEVIAAAIDRVPQAEAKRALAHLFSGEERWQPLGVRGPTAARELGISYDSLRRRGKDGQRRLDVLLIALAEALSDLTSLNELLFGDSMWAETHADPGENAFDRASVFLSYARSDDEHEGGIVTNLRDAVASEFRFQTGQDLFVFQDKTSIDLGENWRRKLEDNLDTTNFLLVLLTPSFLRSTACRDELQRFLRREQQLGRDDLVLPVYYATLPSEAADEDPLARELLQRQYVDWRNLRFQEFASTPVRMAVAGLASAISAAMARSRDIARPTATAVADSPRGLVERLAEMELALPRFIRTMMAMTAEQEGVTEEVHEAQLEVDRLNRMGRGGSARVIVARRLSTKLEPYADRMEECAADMRSDFDTIEDGINAFAEALPTSDEEGIDEAAEGFLKAIRATHAASIPTRASLQDMTSTYADVGRTTSTLRPVLTRLTAAVQVIADSPERFEGWAATLEHACASRKEFLASGHPADCHSSVP